MSVNNTTLKEEATGFTVVAGADLLYTPDGVDIKNGVHLAAMAVTDFAVRPSITLKTRNPQLNDGVFSKAKRWLTIVMPDELADGTVVYNLVRTEIEIHPKTSVADGEDLVSQACQLLFDTDVADFISSGSLA